MFGREQLVFRSGGHEVDNRPPLALHPGSCKQLLVQFPQPGILGAEHQALILITESTARARTGIGQIEDVDNAIGAASQDA